MSPQNILDEIKEKVERGDFDGLTTLLDTLSGEMDTYVNFCNRIRKLAKRYDDDAILKTISG